MLRDHGVSPGYARDYRATARSATGEVQATVKCSTRPVGGKRGQAMRRDVDPSATLALRQVHGHRRVVVTSPEADGKAVPRATAIGRVKGDETASALGGERRVFAEQRHERLSVRSEHGPRIGAPCHVEIVSSPVRAAIRGQECSTGLFVLTGGEFEIRFTPRPARTDGATSIVCAAVARALTRRSGTRIEERRKRKATCASIILPGEKPA